MNQKNKETTIKISVETMEVDEAIKKVEYLNELLEKTKSLTNIRQSKLSITFYIHGEGIERKIERFMEEVVIPLKEKYPYAEIYIEVRKSHKTGRKIYHCCSIKSASLSPRRRWA